MNPIFICFKKQDVISRNYRSFLEAWKPAKLPCGTKLHRLMGTFSFFVDGYNDTPEEIYSIPEVRAFYADLNDIWPYWFFFCDLRTESLQMITACLLQNLEAGKVIGAPSAVLQLDPMELVRFVGNGFAPMNSLCERAGMSEYDIWKRTRDIFEYYALPFDSPPP